MSQSAATPGDMMRIEEQLETVIETHGPRRSARALLAAGYIDIEWAARHTRELARAEQDDEELTE